MMSLGMAFLSLYVCPNNQANDGEGRHERGPEGGYLHHVRVIVYGIHGAQYSNNSCKKQVLLQIKACVVGRAGKDAMRQRAGNGNLITVHDADYRPFARFTSRVVAYDYRGYGFSTGSEDAMQMRRQFVLFLSSRKQDGNNRTLPSRNG